MYQFSPNKTSSPILFYMEHTVFPGKFFLKTNRVLRIRFPYPYLSSSRNWVAMENTRKHTALLVIDMQVSPFLSLSLSTLIEYVYIWLLLLGLWPFSERFRGRGWADESRWRQSNSSICYQGSGGGQGAWHLCSLGNLIILLS